MNRSLVTAEDLRRVKNMRELTAHLRHRIKINLK